MSNAPAGLLYGKGGGGGRLEGDQAVIGITAFAQESLGDITYVELPQAGDALAADKEFGSVESVKAASDLVSPVNGEVLEVNAVLEDAPEKCNSDPYGEGWLVRVKLSGTPEGLMDAAAYEAFCATEAH